MADDERPEETPAAAPESNDGGGSELPEQDAAADDALPNESAGDSAAPSPQTPADQSLAPHRAAKLAGIGVIAALLVAVIVVAAVWSVSAITDDSDDDYEGRDFDDDDDYERRDSDDDEYHERRDSDDGWLQYMEPSEFRDHFDGRRHKHGKGPFGRSRQWDKHWDPADKECADKEYFAESGASSESGVWERSFGPGADSGPVVVVVLGGPGGWDVALPGRDNAGGSGSSTTGFGSGLGAELLAELFAFDLLDDPSVLEGLFGDWDSAAPELHDDSSLDVTELDNLAPAAVEESTPA